MRRQSKRPRINHMGSNFGMGQKIYVSDKRHTVESVDSDTQVTIEMLWLDRLYNLWKIILKVPYVIKKKLL